ncbi:MAG: exodeoxyribonuclease V subunit gamma [Chitinispirillaceae bacterium]|nr:exodeoxyribonuclease V subunit gamma [Chitinispirillaceae bacterium]
MTPGLILHTSNRMELLADRAAAFVARLPASPFAAETIIVPNYGMRQWLSMQLSKRLGIWANGRFLFPNDFVEELFKGIVPGPPDAVFSHSLLAWHCLSVLSGKLPMTEGFSHIRSYCADGRLLTRFQLAAQLADTFDQYMIFRPEMVLAWERGTNDGWQSAFWRMIVHRCGRTHRAGIWNTLCRLPADRLSGRLPERIVAFGLSSLPRYHTAVLEKVATAVPVHLFVLNPCAEFWDDIVSDREAVGTVRSASKGKKTVAAPDSLHLDRGNSLLAALGRYGRDFLSLLHDGNVHEIAAPHDAGSGSLLNALQSDILHLIDRGAPGGPAPLSIDGSDDSLRIHSCHSPLREIEVLHDRLLALFAAYPEYNPSDVLVMTPDIREYEPFIRAVFDSPEQERLAIPYSIADLPLQNENAVARALLSLLSLPRTRFGAATVISLLELPDIRASFSIDASDLPLLSSWIRECNIRWGIDASSLAELGLPATPDNTWEAGLDRLLLGYAIRSSNTLRFKDTLPFDGCEGSAALLAGTLREFISRLSDFCGQAGVDRTLTAWSDLLATLLDDFITETGDNAAELPAVRSLLFDLRLPETGGAFTGTVDFDTVRYVVERGIDTTGSRARFPGNGVTFCSMMPMRSIPFRVVCCIGMNDGAFPRSSCPPSWDLITARPRRGDRSLEKEDRYLFLEAMLSAREKLHISYIGQHPRDNKARVPSIVVEELLSYLQRAYVPSSSGSTAVNGDRTGPPAISDTVVIHHRLQPWNSAYFSGSETLFSYSRANEAAARQLMSGAGRDGQPQRYAIPLEPAVIPAVSMDSLIAFLRNPARFFMKCRLNASLELQDEQLEEHERFLLEGLDRYQLAQRLASHLLNNGSAEEAGLTFKSAGLLPLGNVGDSLFEELVPGVQVFARSIQAFLHGHAALPDVPFNQVINGTSFSGAIAGRYDHCCLAFRYATITPGDWMGLWVRHLALNAFAPADAPRTSVLLCRDRMVRMEPLDNAGQELRTLLDWYALGHTVPLRFFPKTSHAYAEKVVCKNMQPSQAFERAQELWHGSGYARGEKEDPYFSFCFKGALVHDASFTDPTLALWSPLLLHARRTKG